MAGPRMAGSSHNIPSVPRIALPNPHVRKPSLSKSLLSAQSDADGRGSMDLSSIPVPSIPAEYQRDRSLSPPAETIGRAVSTSSPIDGHTPIMSATAQRYTPVEHQVKHISISPDPASNDSGYDSGSSNQKSPVVPMRSMFPTYNPNVPLSQQSYHPQRPPQIRTSSLHLITRSTPEYKDNGVSVERLSRYPSAPPSVVGISETPVQHISSQRELCHLWEASHGMEPNALTNSFHLELARPEEATFTLSSDPLHPFYTMTTYDTNELAISKTHPKKQKVSVEVSLNTIEPAGRRKPPQDGLVTFIFPKMAAMLAINQSTALAKEHGLAPTHRDEVQAAAVRRAAEQEACKLRWNAYSQVYELEHPAIGRRQQGPSFAMSPDPGRSPLNTRQALEIRIHANGNAMPVITVACPQQSDLASEPSPSIPGIRMSTMRNRDSDNALAVLDLNTRILHIEANRILEQLPSLFAIDSIVSALFTVLVADEHVNPVMAEMELWTPKPWRPQSQWGGSISGISGVSHAGSGFYTTFAEREEAEAEAKELAEIHEKDVRQSARKPKNTHKSWFSGKEKAPKQKKKKQIVIADFDMEKLGHYQAGERKGQELPAVTRATLSVLVGGLKAIVWLLTSIVQFITWLLVNLTRCFTSEKF